MCTTGHISSDSRRGLVAPADAAGRPSCQWSGAELAPRFDGGTGQLVSHFVSSWTGHPGIRCFVTHNGGLSTQEAAYHGVPLLAVPFFMDQLLYAVKTERTGLGRSLSYTDIAEDTVYEALTDVIENPR
ncbi:hypothetical protein ONE63_007340 [Megalurothrips usitatus]|uniref:Uncharacterized protein n=1 Tax=Megalurothrips usitatus TaxID=439358 RepID=A0AAV7XYR7_9NEOP|nr:hypothetical protein ONE63_007340 [Megalurothrips usitatus]